MIYVYAILLVALNCVWLFMQVLSLPGNWLMVASAAILEWLEPGMFSYYTLGGIAMLALLGEVLEFMLGAAGAKKGGGSRWGSIGAIIGALVGGIVGTAIIPIVGSIIGACVGAFAGALIMELVMGKPLIQSAKIGKGAALGRLWGTLSKLAVGLAIWVVIAFAAFV